MQTGPSVENALYVVAHSAPVETRPRRDTAAFTGAVRTVSASPDALVSLPDLSESVRENAGRFLSHIRPKGAPPDATRVADEVDLYAIRFMGQSLRVAAQAWRKELNATTEPLRRQPSSFTRMQSYLLGGALLCSSVFGVAGRCGLQAHTFQSGDDNARAAGTLPSKARSTTARAPEVHFHPQVGRFPVGLSERDTPVPSGDGPYFKPLAGSPSRRRHAKRHAPSPVRVGRLLENIYLRAKLPLAEKKRVVEPMVKAYEAMRPRAFTASREDRLMQLDAIALAMAEKSESYRHSYRMIRQALWRRLEKYRHQIAVTRYLEENPSPFVASPLRMTSEGLLSDYFNVSHEHAVVNSLHQGMDSEYLNDLIVDICHTEFRGMSDYISVPPLNQTHRVMFDVSTFSGRLLLVPRYFTTKEIFLGVHKRQAMMQSNGIYFFPKDTDLFLIFALERTPNITDFIDMRLKELLKKLEANERFKFVFESAVYFRAVGLMITALTDTPQWGEINVVAQFLRKEIEPQLVTLWGETVPHLLALPSPLTKEIVYLSLALFEVKVFAQEQYGDDIKTFIAKHLSVFDHQRLKASSLKPRRVCHSRTSLHVANHPACFEPVLRVQYHPHYQQMLYQALIKQIRQSIDSLTYTNAERVSDLTLAWIKGVFDALGTLAGVLSLASTGPVGAAVLATIGVGAGVGDVLVTRRIAEETDDGTLYHVALAHARLGIWFVALGSVLDIALGGRVIIRKFRAYQRSRFLIDGETDISQRAHAAFTATYKRKGSQRAVGAASKPAMPKGRGKRRKGAVYQDSPGFREVKKSRNAAIGSVGYRTIGDNHYVHFYTRTQGRPEAGAKTLLVSAHGGFFNADLAEQAVVLPEHLTVKLLAPHNTFLADPSLHGVINHGKSFNAFLTLKNGKQEVKFRQQSHSEWRYGPYYEPDHPRHALGRPHGLQNYRHYHFEAETPQHISDVLIENRRLAASDQATLSDILVVNDKIALISDTDPAKASLRRVIELDSEGQLVNVLGERYNTIIFSHCRVNFLRPEWVASTYHAVHPPYALRGETSLARLTRSTLHRDNASQPFIQRDDDLGEIAFYPL